MPLQFLVFIYLFCTFATEEKRMFFIYIYFFNDRKWNSARPSQKPFLFFFSLLISHSPEYVFSTTKKKSKHVRI